MLTSALFENADAAARISELLVQELITAADREEFGVIVQDITPLDRSALMQALALSKTVRAKKLRVSLVGYPSIVELLVEKSPNLADSFASDEESVVAWRNRQLRTSVVIAEKPLERAASLRDFRVIDDRTLSRRLCSEQHEKAEVNWLRGLWDALERNIGAGLVLENIVRFAEALDALPAADRSLRAPELLPVLGLFADSHLADTGAGSNQRIERRLRQNRDLAVEIRRATDEDWARIRAFCRLLSSPKKTAANRLVRRLREISSSGKLGSEDFAEVEQLWRGKSIVTNSSQRISNGTARCEVEQVIGRFLMSGDDHRLADISQEVRQIVQSALESDRRDNTFDVRKATSADTVSIVNADRDLLELVRTRSTSEDWGGIIDVAADRPFAMAEVSGFKSWQPFAIQPIISEMKKFVENGIAPEAILTTIDHLIDLRAKLVPFVCELLVSPVATLAGDPVLYNVASAFLESYELLLRQVNAAYSEMHSQADYEAESILGQLLSIELYIYRRDAQVEALMSPLHPLTLWRTVTIVRDIRDIASRLSSREVQTIEEECAKDVQFLQVLVLPQQATGHDQPVLLGQAGLLGRLPIFREAPRGLLEPDGVKTTAELAERLAKMRPFVRPGLQVVFINLPHPARFVEHLLDRLGLEDTSGEETFWGIHIRIRYTDNDTQGWANELDDLSDDLRERLSAGEERGLLSLSVQSEIIGWADVVSQLETRPAHLLVVMDPFHVRSSPVARAQGHGLSPWMPSCEYRYNPIRQEITVIPVAEEHVFGSYLASASLFHPVLQKKTPAHLPQVNKMKEVLDTLAAGSTWTVIADPHLVPIARLGNSEVVDRRIEGGRQLTSFASDLNPFIKRLDAQLRRTHFQADADTLVQLVRDLVAMEPNGILSLASSSHEKQVKGSLGKLIAARWYRNQQPSGLAVSLDTENARRWLVAGNHAQEKADLLGLREHDGSVIIDVIEVKAHDESTPYVVNGTTISGKPVEQALATMHALAEVFSPGNPSPLSKPRREVLREHLYTALLRDQQTKHVERWHSLLDEMFAGSLPVRLSGRIIHVQLSSIASKQSQVYTTAGGVPILVDTLSAADVGLVLKSAKPPSDPIRLDDGIQLSIAQETLEPSFALRQLSMTTSVSFYPMSTVEELRLSVAGDVVEADSHELCLQPPAEAQVIAERDEAESAPLVTLSIDIGTEYASSDGVSWVPGRQSNGFFLILGASGSGKTETLKVLGKAISDSRVPVLIFDFHGDVIFGGLRSVLLSSGSASTVGLNPMELDIHSAEESGLYDQRAALRSMIMRAVPALGHRQSSILRDAFDAAYASAGIVDADATTWVRPAPTFGDIQALLETWLEDDNRKSQRSAVEGCLAAVQELFDHPIFNRDSFVSIDEILQSSMRLDLSKLPENVRFIATETLLRKIFRTLRLRGPIPVVPLDDRERFRLFVIIDEAKILSMGGSDRDRSDNILNELVTEARKFGLGMILASQMSDHFSEEVRANAATWLVLKPMDVREAKRNAPNVSVDADDLIHLGGKGDGYYRDRPSSRARRVQIRRLT